MESTRKSEEDATVTGGAAHEVGKLQQQVRHLEAVLAEVTQVGEKVAAERDCYKAALEQLCEKGYTWDTGAVLKQGKKIRGES